MSVRSSARFNCPANDLNEVNKTSAPASANPKGTGATIRKTVWGAATIDIGERAGIPSLFDFRRRLFGDDPDSTMTEVIREVRCRGGFGLTDPIQMEVLR